jgi:HD-like signal output (HDOD) protein
MALTIKALQVANSAFFGVSQKAQSIPGAIGSLGFDLLRQLVQAERVFEAPAPPNAFPLAVQRHCRRSAKLACEVFAPPDLAYSASVAALLHDVGSLVLDKEMADAYAEVLRRMDGTARPNVCAAEHDLLGTTHAEVGAYIAGMWGFPDLAVQAILHHHREIDWPDLPQGMVDEQGKVHDLSLILALADHFSGDTNPAIQSLAFSPHWELWSRRVEQLPA